MLGQHEGELYLTVLLLFKDNQRNTNTDCSLQNATNCDTMKVSYLQLSISLSVQLGMKHSGAHTRCQSTLCEHAELPVIGSSDQSSMLWQPALHLSQLT